MKKILIISFLSIMMLIAGKGSSALAVMIDFESFSNGDLISGSGVFSDLTFSTNPNYDIRAVQYNPGPVFGGLMSARCSDYKSILNFRADFLIGGVNYVSVVMGDYWGDEDYLYLRAYDSSNNLLSEDTDYIDWYVAGGPMLSVSGSNINYVKFGSTGTDPNSIYFDNFAYSNYIIPEPASLSLLGLGLLGLAFKKRKGAGK